MPIPTVYIEREPLLNMILASVEVYNRECLGYVFGYIPNERHPYFIITNAVNLAAVVRRTSTGIHQSARGNKRIHRFINAVPKLYRYLGDFHSHPTAKGGCGHLFNLSSTDAKSFSDVDQFGVIITIKRRAKRIMEWCLRSNRTRLRGSLGDFDVHLTAHALVRDSEGKPLLDQKGDRKSQRLQIIVARGTLEALNRAAKKS